MLFVLYQNSGCHSGRALRAMLAQETGEKVAGGFPKRFKKFLRDEGQPDIVVNLGTTDEYPYEGRMLNCQDMVRAAANKKEARKIFCERGVAAPALYTNHEDIPRNGFPVIGRTSFHSKGRGFWLCKNAKAAQTAAKNGATHFISFIPGTREYRVHAFIKIQNQKTEKEKRTSKEYISIKVSEKVWQGREEPDTNAPQKNHNFGWTFMGPQNRSEEELNVVRHAAKTAIASLGMDFGAVDVMYHIRTKRPYVLEVNSTPSLADENADTCERYAKRISKMVEKG